MLADLVFGDDEAAGYLDLRLRAFFDELGPNPLSDSQQRVTDLVAAKKAALVRSTLGDLGEWATSLRSLANHLDDLSAKAERAASKELGDA